MNRDLLLDKLAEKMAQDHSSDISNDAFLIIMKTIHTILDHQEEATQHEDSQSAKLDEIITKLDTEFKNLKDGNAAIYAQLRDAEIHQQAMLTIISKMNEKINSLEQKIDTNANAAELKFNSIQERIELNNTEITTLTDHQDRWMKFWEKALIYFIAFGSLITILSVANGFGLFKIVWPGQQ